MFKRCQSAIAILLLVFSAKAMAQTSCTRAAGASELVWSINVGAIVVQRDAPVGTVLLDRDLTSAQYNRALLSCTGTGNGQTSAITLTTAVPDMAGYYATNVAGVGVRVDYPIGLADRQFTNPATRWSFTTGFYIPGPFRFRLVKTGPITGGTLTTGRLFNWTTPQTGGGTLSVGRGDITGGSITQVACQPRIRGVWIGVPPVTTADFRGVGSTVQSGTVPLSLTCDVGARISLRLDGTAVGAPENGILALSPPSTAKGIGVQLRYRDNPVTLGATFETGVTSTGGQQDFSIPWTYIQTEPFVQAGSVTATVSYTFTYN